jgi:hypothetical protein
MYKTEDRYECRSIESIVLEMFQEDDGCLKIGENYIFAAADNSRVHQEGRLLVDCKLWVRKRSSLSATEKLLDHLGHLIFRKEVNEYGISPRLHGEAYLSDENYFELKNRLSYANSISISILPFEGHLASLKFGSFGGLEWDAGSYGDRQLSLKLIEVGISFNQVANPEIVDLKESAGSKRLSGLLDSALTELKTIKFILIFIAAALAVEYFIL